MDDLICPKCKQKHLHMHSVLIPGKTADSVDVHYEWMCGWCAYREGNYETATAAKEDYNKKYGGNK